MPRTLTHMETRELLRGIPLEDGALEELMLGMHIGDVVMILHFEETDGEGECSMIIRQEPLIHVPSTVINPGSRG